MRFYTKQHNAYGGIDLHARRMSVCLLHHEGESMLHHQMNTRPATFLQAMAPDREDLVVAVDCILTWSWLADLCAQAQMPFGLGHARYLQAIHGGKAQTDTLDAQHIAVLRRGGRLPQASVDPAAMRATRDLLRRRLPLTRNRAALRAHLQQTNSPDNLPEMGQKLAYKANRDGVVARCSAPAVQQRGAVDRALIGGSDQLLRDVELPLGPTATPHDAPPWSRRQAVPGIGKMLRVVLRYELQAMSRFPRVQGRRVRWPSGHMRPAICGETRRHVRRTARQGLAHVGVFGSGGALAPESSGRPTRADPLGETTWHGQRVNRLRPSMSPCGG
jgi:hypothetical protein